MTRYISANNESTFSINTGQYSLTSTYVALIDQALLLFGFGEPNCEYRAGARNPEPPIRGLDCDAPSCSKRACAARGIIPITKPSQRPFLLHTLCDYNIPWEG